MHNYFHSCAEDTNDSINTYEAVLDKRVHAANFEVEIQYDVNSMVEVC